MRAAHQALAQYRTVRSHGLVADAGPERLVQIVLEHILAELTTAQGCMQRIKGNLPFSEVKTKCDAMSKAIRLINHLNATLDLERGGEVARNLRALYEFLMPRLTLANAHNDAAVVNEAIGIVRTIKTGWDGIVPGQR
jgi:flagellar protein FliS